MRRHRITALRFTENTVSFRLDGEPVWDRVEVSRRVPMVGHYSRGKPVVRVDRKITDPKERRSLIVHEAVERTDIVRNGMKPHRAHVLAQATERHVATTTLRMSRHRWDTYTQNVEHVFRQNRRAGERRRR